MPTSNACWYCPKGIGTWEPAAAVLDAGYAWHYYYSKPPHPDGP